MRVNQTGRAVAMLIGGTAIGPLLGLATIIVAFTISQGKRPPAAQEFPLLLLGAYWVGALPALLFSLLLAIRIWQNGALSWLYVFCVSAAVATVTLIAACVLFGASLGLLTAFAALTAGFILGGLARWLLSALSGAAQVME